MSKPSGEWYWLSGKSMPNDFRAQAEAMQPHLVEMRRDLHRHPELAYQEERTAGIVARELHALGIEVQGGVAQTGVIGLLEGDRPGPTVMLRFDMDALPIQEANQTNYVSESPGVMHACGHDGHVTIGLGTARLLSKLRSRLVGRVKFIFQPAEEGMNGAEAMIRAGALQNPRPDVAVGLHLWNAAPFGTIGLRSGPMMAAGERLSCRVRGKGGHGAAPHETVDPVVAAAQIITALQTVVSRNVSPLETAVVSITTIHGGDAFNVIPSEVTMTGTIRSFDPQVRELLLRRVREIVEGMAAAMGAEADLQLDMLTPAVMNDPTVTTVVQNVAEAVVGPENIRADATWIASEDMAYFLQQIPGCFFFLGSANAERRLNYPHHNPRFDFDERALALGVTLMAEIARRYLIPGE